MDNENKWEAVQTIFLAPPVLGGGGMVKNQEHKLLPRRKSFNDRAILRMTPITEDSPNSQLRPRNNSESLSIQETIQIEKMTREKMRTSGNDVTPRASRPKEDMKSTPRRKSVSIIVPPKRRASEGAVLSAPPTLPTLTIRPRPHARRASIPIANISRGGKQNTRASLPSTACGIYLYMKLYMAKLNREATREIQQREKNKERKTEKLKKDTANEMQFASDLSTEAQYAILLGYDDKIRESLNPSPTTTSRPKTPVIRTRLTFADAKEEEEEEDVILRKHRLSQKFRHAMNILDATNDRSRQSVVPRIAKTPCVGTTAQLEEYEDWRKSWSSCFINAPSECAA